MKLRIEIDTGSAAFNGSYRISETARILRKLALRLERGEVRNEEPTDKEPWALLDVDGKNTGTAKWVK